MEKYIDFHCHILPGMDFDGTDDIEESVSMCKLLKSQGVTTICATPHFYPWEDDVEAFLLRRQRTLDLLKSRGIEIEIIPGAEVQIFRSLAEYPIDKMCIGESNVVLLELPETGFANWMIPAIENTVYKYSLVPVIAHIERYGFKKETLQKIAGLPGVIFQISVDELAHRSTVRTLDIVSSIGVPVVLGSDAHDMISRKPNFDIVTGIREKKANIFNKLLKTKQALVYNALYSQQILEEQIRVPSKVKDIKQSGNSGK